MLGVNLHQGVTRRSADDGRPAASEDLSAYKIVQPGNVVMNRLGKPHGSVGVSPWLGITSPAYWVMPVNRSLGDPRFFHHLLRSRHLIAEYERLGKNQPPNQFDISWDAFRAIELPLPPLEEQRRIADFLDAEITRIDSLISAREHQLALLTERFLARVFDAVRGANESGTRKDSGRDWLGTIPSPWPIMPVTYQFEVLLGKMLNRERSHGAHLAPYLRNTNVQWDRIDTDDLLLMDFPPEEHRRYVLQPGDLLVCEGGDPGRAAIWQGHTQVVYYQKALHRVRARSYSSPRWLFYCLRAATAQNVFAVEGNTTTIAHLTGEQFRAHRFPFPERDTQDRLTAKLDADNQSQQQLEKLLHQQLMLLAERRQALITAAVTGQFDVTTASGRNVTEGVSA
ncbi:restriction endonuclease subunit S [Streptomyces rochei]|uniref:restriction endonuclease subunit S n=1 Tax=Streptomyces rochei TaxID=1928 RepID=UPI0036287BBB